MFWIVYLKVIILKISVLVDLATPVLTGDNATHFLTRRVPLKMIQLLITWGKKHTLSSYPIRIINEEGKQHVFP